MTDRERNDADETRPEHNGINDPEVRGENATEKSDFQEDVEEIDPVLPEEFIALDKGLDPALDAVQQRLRSGV